MDAEAAKLIATALALLPMFGVALALGNIFGSFKTAVSRNPSVEKTLFGKLIFGFAVTEALGLICFVVAMMIFGS